MTEKINTLTIELVTDKIVGAAYGEFTVDVFVAGGILCFHDREVEPIGRSLTYAVDKGQLPLIRQEIKDFLATRERINISNE